MLLNPRNLMIALLSLCLPACSTPRLGNAPIISTIEKPVVLEIEPISEGLTTLPEVVPPSAQTWGDMAALKDFYERELRLTRTQFEALVAAIRTREDIAASLRANIEARAAELEAEATAPPEKRKRILGIF